MENYVENLNEMKNFYSIEASKQTFDLALKQKFPENSF